MDSRTGSGQTRYRALLDEDAEHSPALVAISDPAETDSTEADP